MVRKGIVSDANGNTFIYPGIGYGGTCFLPKDVKALIKTEEGNGYQMQILKAVNEKQKPVLFEKLMICFQ